MNKAVKVVGGTFVGLVVVGAALGHGSAASTKKPSSPVAAASVPVTTAVADTASKSSADASSVQQPASTPAKPVLVYSKKGSGISNTPNFTVGSTWELAYSFNCANFGMPGNFQTTINDSTGTMDFAKADGANALAKSGSDTLTYHGGGSYSVSVNSECAWTIKVYSVS